jgi:hypothetical protein
VGADGAITEAGRYDEQDLEGWRGAQDQDACDAGGDRSVLPISAPDACDAGGDLSCQSLVPREPLIAVLRGDRRLGRSLGVIDRVDLLLRTLCATGGD